MNNGTRKYDAIPIPGDAVVSYVEAGWVQEVKYVCRRNTRATILKLDADHYGVIDYTLKAAPLIGGYPVREIRQFTHTDNRAQNLDGLRKTMRNLRFLINGNFIGGRREVFITLTYADNMRDTVRLKRDFNNFIKRLKRHLRKKYDISDEQIYYLGVVEPQARGAFHVHLLVRAEGCKSLRIETDILDRLWPHGFTNIRRLSHVDNLGAYLVAYLTDVVVDEDNSPIEADIGTKTIGNQARRVAKGARLHLYPAHMNIYRKSRNVVMPQKQTMRASVAAELVGDAPCVFSSEKTITVNDFSTSVITNVYNAKPSRQPLGKEGAL